MSGFAAHTKQDLVDVGLAGKPDVMVALDGLAYFKCWRNRGPQKLQILSDQIPQMHQARLPSEIRTAYCQDPVDCFYCPLSSFDNLAQALPHLRRHQISLDNTLSQMSVQILFCCAPG